MINDRRYFVIYRLTFVLKYRSLHFLRLFDIQS